MDSHNWIADQLFRCVTADDRTFELVVRIGEPATVPPSEDGAHAYGRCRLSLVPLAADRWIAGQNHFQALCLALDHIRVVFKVFLAEGGRIYWEDTDSIVDIDSPWFAPLPSASSLSLGGVGGRA